MAEEGPDMRLASLVGILRLAGLVIASDTPEGTFIAPFYVSSLIWDSLSSFTGDTMVGNGGCMLPNCSPSRFDLPVAATSGTWLGRSACDGTRNGTKM